MEILDSLLISARPLRIGIKIEQVAPVRSRQVSSRSVVLDCQLFQCGCIWNRGKVRSLIECSPDQRLVSATTARLAVKKVLCRIVFGRGMELAERRDIEKPARSVYIAECPRREWSAGAARHGRSPLGSRRGAPRSIKNLRFAATLKLANPWPVMSCPRRNGARRAVRHRRSPLGSRRGSAEINRTFALRYPYVGQPSGMPFVSPAGNGARGAVRHRRSPAGASVREERESIEPSLFFGILTLVTLWSCRVVSPAGMEPAGAGAT